MSGPSMVVSFLPPRHETRKPPAGSRSESPHFSDVTGAPEVLHSTRPGRHRIRRMPDPTSFDALLEQAQALIDAGRHAEALPLFDQALLLQPDSAYGWFCRGCACSALGQPGEAARCYLE